MTDFEYGFMRKCAEHGLSQGQAGFLCKIAMLDGGWQAGIKKNDGTTAFGPGSTASGGRAPVAPGAGAGTPGAGAGTPGATSFGPGRTGPVYYPSMTRARINPGTTWLTDQQLAQYTGGMTPEQVQKFKDKTGYRRLSVDPANYARVRDDPYAAGRLMQNVSPEERAALEQLYAEKRDAKAVGDWNNGGDVDVQTAVMNPVDSRYHDMLRSSFSDPKEQQLAMQRFTDKMWNEDAGEQGTLVGRAFGNFSDWIGLTDPRKRAYNRRREREQQAERLYGETMEEMERDQYRAEANARRLQDMAQSRANEQWYRTNKPKENVSPEAVAAAKKGPVPVVTGASTNPYTKTTPPPETPPKTTTA